LTLASDITVDHVKVCDKNKSATIFNKKLRVWGSLDFVFRKAIYSLK